jgi:hypothetical protein
MIDQHQLTRILDDFDLLLIWMNELCYRLSINEFKKDRIKGFCMEYRLEKRLDCGLIVVFSPINIPKGKFGFSRFFEEEKRSVLFFNCENTWYVDCIEEMKEVIDSVLNRLKPSSVVFYGASMGGYAAMRIGGLYPKYPTFLFGPELELYIPGSLSHKNATIRQDNVNILAHTNLDLSNTVVLFGIYEPIDLKQYQISLELNFYATIAVKSPHAVHEELYYRNLVRPLANSTSCTEFIENLPSGFIDLEPLVEYSNIFYNLFFFSKKETQQNDVRILKKIHHPSSYWVLLKLALRFKDFKLVLYVEEKLTQYFLEFSKNFTMPPKFHKQINNIKSQLK